jgi:spore coat protein U-like protein
MSVICGLAGSAVAATKTGQFAVRAQVIDECQVSASDLDFGSYNPNGSARASMSLTVKCAPHSNVTIFLGPGSSGNPKKRTLRYGEATMRYQIYKDAALTDAIDSNGITFHLKPNDNNGQPVTYMVYGDVPSGQSVPLGGYSDIVQVTINY